MHDLSKKHLYQLKFVVFNELTVKHCRGNTRKWLPGLTNKAPPSQRTSSFPDLQILSHPSTQQHGCKTAAWKFCLFGLSKISVLQEISNFLLFFLERNLEAQRIGCNRNAVPTHHTFTSCKAKSNIWFTSDSTDLMSAHFLLTLLKIFLSFDGNQLFAKEERSTTEASSPIHYRKWSQEGHLSLHLMTQQRESLCSRNTASREAACPPKVKSICTHSICFFCQFNSNSHKCSSDLTRA